jgi:hypothetical protein
LLGRLAPQMGAHGDKCLGSGSTESISQYELLQ